MTKDSDNCPRCEQKRNDALEQEAMRIENLYGTIPSEEWLADRRKVYTELRATMSLREEREFKKENGQIVVTYKAHCTDCHWQFSFEHRVTVPA